MPRIRLQDELDAYEPWVIEIDGQEYEAKPVSQMARLRFDAEVEQAKGDPVAEERALRRLLRVAFPVRGNFWRYWRAARDPVHRILTLDPIVRTRVLRSFFDALSGRPTPSGPTTTDGSAPSSGATP